MWLLVFDNVLQWLTFLDQAAVGGPQPEAGSPPVKEGVRCFLAEAGMTSVMGPSRGGCSVLLP